MSELSDLSPCLEPRGDLALPTAHEPALQGLEVLCFQRTRKRSMATRGYDASVACGEMNVYHRVPSITPPTTSPPPDLIGVVGRVKYRRRYTNQQLNKRNIYLYIYSTRHYTYPCGETYRCVVVGPCDVSEEELTRRREGHGHAPPRHLPLRYTQLLRRLCKKKNA